MSLRPKRALVGLAVAAAALAALPASALAAGESLAISATSVQAGGLTNASATLTFASGDTPSTVVTSLAPGMLGNLNANPTCLVSTQLTSACSIGTETTHLNAPPPSGTDVSGTMYLVPPQGTDAAGIDAVSPSGTQYIGISLNPKAPGGLNLTTTFPKPTTPGLLITGFTANFTTLNGQPFTRMPSSCGPATSTISVDYYNGTPTGSASNTFTPTGCASLPYAPKLSSTITRDKSGNGAAMVMEITQAASESASKSIVLQLPRGLTPNVTADIPCLTGTGAGCTVGTATATSPLVPNAALANGTLTLSGTANAPTIAISFPKPFAITIAGTVSLTTNSVTFADVPDVPLTSLTLNITGPNNQKAFNTDCAPANIGGTFTPQSGSAPVSVTSKITFNACALKPTAGGSTGGLAAGHPKLKFRIVHGKGAANVRTVVIGLPGGLKFSRSAIVRHRVCTTKGKKKKCTTTTLIKGLGIRGGRAKSVAIRNGRLVVTLKKPSGRFMLSISGPLVTEGKGLQTKVKKHKTKFLRFTLKITDAKHTTSTLFTRLRAH